MKRMLCYVVLPLLFPMAVIAGGNSHYTPPSREKELVPASKRAAWVSVRVPVDAYIVSLVISSAAPDEAARLADLERADRILHDSPPRGTSVLDNPVPDAQPEENRDIEYVNTPIAKGGPLVRSIYVPINKNSSAIAVMQAIREYTKAAKWPAKVSVETRGLLASVAKPEQYRAPILKLIAQDVALLRETFGQAVVILLDGLQNPLRTRMVNDKEADLVMEYLMSTEIR